MCADARPAAVRPAPSHALTEDEHQAVLETTPRQARGPLCSPITPLCRRTRSSRAWPIRGSTCLPAAGRYVTPRQRHSGEDVAILRQRHELYEAAQRQHPTRWSSDTRKWGHIREVWLNPKNNRTLTTKVA